MLQEQAEVQAHTSLPSRKSKHKMYLPDKDQWAAPLVQLNVAQRLSLTAGKAAFVPLSEGTQGAPKIQLCQSQSPGCRKVVNNVKV